MTLAQVEREESMAETQVLVGSRNGLTYVRLFGRAVDKWALNFGVGSAFALMMLSAGIYFAGRLLSAQDRTAEATVKMEVLLTQSATADAERAARADAHYAEAARREADAAQRNERILVALQKLGERVSGPLSP